MTDLNTRILREARELSGRLVSWRRHLHRYPELGLELPGTAAFIRDVLEKEGVEILNGSPGYSLVARIKGRCSESPIGLRADMDALNIPENTGLSYASENPQRMHACGHDGHMAMLLGAAVLIRRHRELLPRDCYFIFQPGEEDPGGAQALMESGLLDNLSSIFGIHLDPQQPTGFGTVNRDKAMASTDSFTIVITGKGGHAALPHRSVDPIAVSARVINSLQFIVSRLIDPVEPAVLTLGSIQGGYRPNVIPDDVTLSGTIRAFSRSIRDQLKDEIEKTLMMYCNRYGATYSFDLVPGYPPVINNPAMSRFVRDRASVMDPYLKISVIEKPLMTGEDFSYYLEKIPGAFIMLGCRHEEKQCRYPLHHSKFNLDEDALPLGAALHCLCALGADGLPREDDSC